jgi:hypothetical protein
VSSEARGKSCSLKVLLSQGKRPVARQPLAVISLVAAAELFANLVDVDDSPALSLNGAILKFLGSRTFSGGPRKLYPSVALCNCREVGEKCQHDSLEPK